MTLVLPSQLSVMSRSSPAHKGTPRSPREQEQESEYLRAVDGLRSPHHEPLEIGGTDESDDDEGGVFSPRAMRTIVDELWSQRASVPRRVEKHAAVQRLSGCCMRDEVLKLKTAGARWRLVRNVVHAVMRLKTLLREEREDQERQRRHRGFVLVMSGQVRSHLRN